MDIAEKMAADIALAIDGGDWQDAKWFSKFHREAWIKAVQPYADEIERLREALNLERQLKDDALRAFNESQAADEIERLREENQRRKEHTMLLYSLVQTEHEMIRIAALKEGE